MIHKLLYMLPMGGDKILYIYMCVCVHVYMHKICEGMVLTIRYCLKYQVHMSLPEKSS